MNRFAPLGLICALLPFSALADIQGNTAGGVAAGVGIDDFNITQTLQALYCTNTTPTPANLSALPCNYLSSAAGANPVNPGASLLTTLNGLGFGTFAYAGTTVNGVAMPAPIPSGDFTVSNYVPWVVNNNATTNNITSPSGANINRGVTGQDAGGADIQITYTPGKNNPTSVNFLQAYDESMNGGAVSGLIIDGLVAGKSPYYNYQGVSGTGKKSNFPPGPPNPNSMNANGSNAWLIDIPYDCENGPTANANCTGGVDDTTLSESVNFETFIEAPYTKNGKTYNVLYGAVEWGYFYSNYDLPAPEATSALTLMFMFSMVVCGTRFRSWQRTRQRG